MSAFRYIADRRWATVASAFLLGATGTAVAISADGPAPSRGPAPAAFSPLGGVVSGLGSGVTALLGTGQLPAPPAPQPGAPAQPALLPNLLNPADAKAALLSLLGGPRPALPATARAWGPAGSATTLVLYDTTDAFGWLGELYGIAAGNLASHFGTVTAEPVGSYAAGQMASFTSVVYLGSTYNEPVPAAFLNDVLADVKPVVWAGDNVWQLSGPAGGAAQAAFTAKYGWDPSTSYFDTADTVTRIAYKGQTLARDAADQGGILAPHIADPAKVTVLATGQCADSSGTAVPCSAIAQTNGASTLPWAIRSANLTYLGEIPFAYVSEHDRYLAFTDLLFAADAPNAPGKHQALVRIEDVNPTTDPAQIRAIADYLGSQGVPFSIGVIPEYTDPTGAANNGVPKKLTLTQSPLLVTALLYAQLRGGTVIQHGFTHQYSNVANPYNGVTADDFEFYRSQCSTTQNPPYQYDVPCQNTDWVTLQGPVPGDSQSWAQGRAATGRTLMLLGGMLPTIWETPHYAASAADYAGIGAVYNTRYERELFFGGQLAGTPDATHVFGQYFPFLVHDVYGATVIPENLGNYEPLPANNHPARSAADVVANAQANLVVTQGVASFFFHPYYPLDRLKAIVSGVKGLGYSFVSPGAVLAGR